MFPTVSDLWRERWATYVPERRRVRARLLESQVRKSFLRDDLITAHFENNDLRQFVRRFEFNTIKRVKPPPDDSDWPANQLWKASPLKKGIPSVGCDAVEFSPADSPE
jgi:hypothetical protein